MRRGQRNALVLFIVGVLLIALSYLPVHSQVVKAPTIWPVGGLALCSPPDADGNMQCIRIPEGSVLIVPAPPDTTDARTKS